MSISNSTPSRASTNISPTKGTGIPLANSCGFKAISHSVSIPASLTKIFRLDSRRTHRGRGDLQDKKKERGKRETEGEKDPVGCSSRVPDGYRWEVPRPRFVIASRWNFGYDVLSEHVNEEIRYNSSPIVGPCLTINKTRAPSMFLGIIQLNLIFF